MLTRQEAKRIIEDLESFRAGYDMLSGCEVEARNIRLRKDKVIADIIFHEWEDGRHDRYNGCEYPIELLERFAKRRTNS